MPIHYIDPNAKPDPTRRYRCRHIFTDGRRCGSPSLRGLQFCYYHHRSREKFSCASRHGTFTFPPIDDRAALQIAIHDVLTRIAAGDIDLKFGTGLLYGLQIASSNLGSAEHPTSPHVDQVEEVFCDLEGKLIAPATEMDPDPPTAKVAPPQRPAKSHPAQQAPPAITIEPPAIDPEPEPLPEPWLYPQPAILPALQATAASDLHPPRTNPRVDNETVEPWGTRIVKGGRRALSGREAPRNPIARLSEKDQQPPPRQVPRTRPRHADRPFHPARPPNGPTARANHSLGKAPDGTQNASPPTSPPESDEPSPTSSDSIESSPWDV